MDLSLPMVCDEPVYIQSTLMNVLNKPLDSTFVAIEEVALENWCSS
jgi:hypothetical protein